MELVNDFGAKIIIDSILELCRCLRVTNEAWLADTS